MLKIYQNKYNYSKNSTKNPQDIQKLPYKGWLGKNTENCEEYCTCKKTIRPKSNAKYLHFEGRFSFTNTVQNDKKAGRGK